MTIIEQRNAFKRFISDLQMDYTEQDSLGIYLREIAKYPLLTREQEIELGERARSGDESARELLVKSNLRLVVHIAKWYLRKGGLPLEDLVGEGNIGLIKAVENYDFEKGSFCTYASFWINKKIAKKIIGRNGEKIPNHLVTNFFTANRFIRNFYPEKGRYPLNKELAQELRWTIEKANRVMSFFDEPSSLEDEYLPRGDDGVSVPDLRYSPEKEIIKDVLKEDIQKAFGCLSERDAEIVRSHFGFNGEKKTFKKLGKIYRISSEGARLAKERALKKLRTNSEGLRAYLE